MFEQAQACIQEILDEGDVSHDNVQTSCQGYEPRQCAHFYQKYCDLKDRIMVIETACSAKLSKHRLRERETKRAQEEFEREQRQRAEAQRQQAQAAHRQQMSQRNRILQDATRATMTGKGLGQAGKYATQLQRSPKQTGLTKYRMAYQAAHGRLPTLNAHSLSGLLTKYGTRFVLGANAAAQQDLRDALSQFDNSFGGQNSQSQGSIYNATNPRPFATQIDEAFALNDKVQAHIDRVTDAVQRLPVGDQSMVNTPAGNLLSEIVKARANGDISSFSNALIDYVSFAIKEAPQEYKEARASQSVDVDLRKERLAVLAMVEAEVKRLAAIVANERKKRKAANARRQKAANARRQSEARMRQQQWEYDQHMRKLSNSVFKIQLIFWEG